jgi:hypothetical protein
MSKLVEGELVAVLRKSPAKTNNHTFFVQIELSGGEVRDVVVKPGLSPGRRLYEWAGAELARHLGIATPDSFAVRVGANLIAALSSQDAPLFSPGVLYGSA